MAIFDQKCDFISGSFCLVNYLVRLALGLQTLASIGSSIIISILTLDIVY